MSHSITTINNDRQPATVVAQPRPKPKALEIMAARLSVEPSKMLETLKATVFKGATNEELMALTVVANEYDLNPFLKELYAFPAKGGGIVPVVSVDGWIKMLNRQERFDGIDFEFQDSPEGKPISCMAIIHIKGRGRPVAVQEFYSECARNTDPWNKSPRRMLRHKALIQCARVAFGFSGVQDEDEARLSGVVDEAQFASAKAVFSTAPSLPLPSIEKAPKPIFAEAPPEDQPAPPQNVAAGPAEDAAPPSGELPLQQAPPVKAATKPKSAPAASKDEQPF